MTIFVVTDSNKVSHFVEAGSKGDAFISVPGAELVRTAQGPEISAYYASLDEKEENKE